MPALNLRLTRTAPVSSQPIASRPSIRKGFGVADRYGREIGGWAKIDERRYEEVPAQHIGFAVPAGKWYVLVTHNTRGGGFYGTSGVRYFKTLKEARAARESWFRTAEKRALRTAGR